MWDNPRLLNLAAGALCGVALFGLAIAGAVLIARSPLFPVRTVELTHPLANTTREEIEAATRGRIPGNFFALAADEVRARLERLPWVRRASVRRVWPDRLEVTLEEHVPLARWGSRALLSIEGERFAGVADASLPVFIAADGAEREVARRYAGFAEAAAALGAKLERVALSERGAWQLKLDNGLTLMLGRDADGAQARLARFVQAYAIAFGRPEPRATYIDLRYPNGFAVRFAGAGS